LDKLHECFFVTPIGISGSNERKRADLVLEHVLRPISKGLLKITRADEVDEPGTITTDIVKRLYSDELVIADLTGQNPNVMYEIGLRHCFNLPIVHIAQDGEKPPFDLAAERIIFFDINDLDSVAKGKKRILSSCKQALNAKPFRSPVARALAQETLFSASPATPSKFDLEAKLEDIQNAIGDIEDNVINTFSDLDFSFHHSNATSTFDDIMKQRLGELLHKFDRVGPSQIEKLAKLAESLLEKDQS
jgi:hypothetical protein